MTQPSPPPIGIAPIEMAQCLHQTPRLARAPFCDRRPFEGARELLLGLLEIAFELAPLGQHPRVGGRHAVRPPVHLEALNPRGPTPIREAPALSPYVRRHRQRADLRAFPPG
jgi:hypothetical protein